MCVACSVARPVLFWLFCFCAASAGLLLGFMLMLFMLMVFDILNRST